MRRAFVFLLLGPASAAFVASWICIAVLSPRFWQAAVIAALGGFILTVPFSACVGYVDGCLARALPPASRVPLSALFGAAMAFGMICALTPPMSLLPWMFALGAAFSMGGCALLSRDHHGETPDPVHRKVPRRRRSIIFYPSITPFHDTHGSLTGAAHNACLYKGEQDGVS